MARPRAAADAVVSEKIGDRGPCKVIGSPMPSTTLPPRWLAIEAIVAQTLRMAARANPGQGVLTRFDLAPVRDGYLQEKLKHPEAVLP